MGKKRREDQCRESPAVLIKHPATPRSQPQVPDKDNEGGVLSDTPRPLWSQPQMSNIRNPTRSLPNTPRPLWSQPQASDKSRKDFWKTRGRSRRRSKKSQPVAWGKRGGRIGVEAPQASSSSTPRPQGVSRKCPTRTTKEMFRLVFSNFVKPC